MKQKKPDEKLHSCSNRWISCYISDLDGLVMRVEGDSEILIDYCPLCGFKFEEDEE
jgi:hypothetical protein